MEFFIGGFFALVCVLGIFKASSAYATAQINDGFIYNGKEYAISALEHPRAFFDIRELGLTPAPQNTAVWRGYVATFTIDPDNRLLLTNLSTNNGNGKSEILPINGVSPQITKPDRLAAGYENWRDLEYNAIQLPIGYTGGMLITSGFIRERYVHMGFQSPWSFKEVIELVFSDGICIDVYDLSEAAAKRRAQRLPVAPDGSSREDVSEWIRKTFDLSYEHRGPKQR